MGRNQRQKSKLKRRQKMELNKKFRRKNKDLDLGRITNEILNLQQLQNYNAAPGQTPGLIGFNPHKINFDGKTGWVYDAKAINKQRKQTGRGDFRYFFQDKQFTGTILQHSENNYALA
jgi:hypothetical protein